MTTASRLPEFDLAELDDESRAVAEDVMRGRGRLPTPFRVWLQSPPLAERLAPLGDLLAHSEHLSKLEREIVILYAARRWRARYVAVVHQREARAAGLDQEATEAISEGRPPVLDEPRQQVIAQIMAGLSEEEFVPEQLFDAAVKALGPAGVAELLALAGYFSAVGLAMKLYDVVPKGSP